MPRCLLLYTCGHGSDWNTWFQLFGWVSEYFWQYSVCAAYSPRGSTSRQSLNCDGISSANMGQKVTSSFQYFELWSSTSWESMYKQEYGHRQPLLCRINSWILCKTDTSNTWMACSNQWPQRSFQPQRPFVKCKCKFDSSSVRCSCRAKDLACTDMCQCSSQWWTMMMTMTMTMTGTMIMMMYRHRLIKKVASSYCGLNVHVDSSRTSKFYIS